jgi:hypothetical protein
MSGIIVAYRKKQPADYMQLRSISAREVKI